MQQLYSPWRDEYVKIDKKLINDCVFCDIANSTNDDTKLAVLFRNKNFFIVMNRYPYIPGHFMIVPNFHTANLEDLDMAVWLDMTKTAHKLVPLLKDILKAQGVNIGMNLGKAAGAGIEKHIHLHLLPRYKADTNFITTIANTRVYSVDFDKIYKKLLQNIKNYI
ncbi:MAG: HIT family hydrolase [Campylobacteraceae bacterium 4484_166]|nr:MAG: HIT family hydrolase [Campylobacteraceae bacterium 4484_166]